MKKMPQPVRPTACRHCAAAGLWWLPRKRGDYRLMNPDGSFHVCHAPVSADEFEDVSAQSTPQPADVRADQPLSES